MYNLWVGDIFDYDNTTRTRTYVDVYKCNFIVQNKRYNSCKINNGIKKMFTIKYTTKSYYTYYLKNFIYSFEKTKQPYNKAVNWIQISNFQKRTENVQKICTKVLNLNYSKEN